MSEKEQSRAPHVVRAAKRLNGLADEIMDLPSRAYGVAFEAINIADLECIADGLRNMAAEVVAVGAIAEAERLRRSWQAEVGVGETHETVTLTEADTPHLDAVAEPASGTWPPEECTCSPEARADGNVFTRGCPAHDPAMPGVVPGQDDSPDINVTPAPPMNDTEWQTLTTAQKVEAWRRYTSYGEKWLTEHPLVA